MSVLPVVARELRVLSTLTRVQWVRVALAGIVMTSYAIAMGIRLEPGRNWRHYLFMGVLNTALPWAMYAYAANYINASYLGILNATTPWFGALPSRRDESVPDFLRIYLFFHKSRVWIGVNRIS